MRGGREKGRKREDERDERGTTGETREANIDRQGMIKKDLGTRLK